MVKRTIAYLNSGAVGIGLYLLTNKILYVILNKKSIYSQSDLKNLPTAVIVAYERFFDFFKTSLYGINPYKGIRYMMILLLLITIVVFCREIFSKEIEVKNKIMASIFFVLFPVAVNFVYIITLNNVMVHSLMLYPMCSIFILFCAISEIGDTSRNSRIWTYVSSIGIFCLIGSFIKVDNVAYQYCSFVQEQTMTYYTNLINRIQSCDGYDASLPVAFLNIEDAEDESMMLQRKFDVSLTALEFDMRQVVSDYAYKQYLGLHCGYDPSYVDSETIKVLKEKTEVRKMSSYPEEDSIKVIDGIVVVKFAEIQ